MSSINEVSWDKNTDSPALLFDRVSIDSELVDWPFTIPAIAHMREHGLTFTNRLTIIVGDNGSGKSTFIEALAEKVSLNASGGARSHAKPVVTCRLTEYLTIHYTLTGLATVKRKKPRLSGFFLRSETSLAMMEAYEGVKEFNPSYRTPWNHVDPRKLSHGEGFIEILASVLEKPGIILLDEPESGLNFQKILQLMLLIQQALHRNPLTHIICATHSPILAAIPGATLLEFTNQGINENTWEKLELVTNTQQFLNHPQQYLQHLYPQQENITHR